MDFYEFTRKLKQEVERLCGEGVTVEILKTEGNNGVGHTGMNITKNGEKVSPFIRLDDYYEFYMEGGVSVEVAAEEIYEAFTTAKAPGFGDISAEFEKVKDKIIYSLVDYGRNQETLKDVPYIPFCDLAVIFRLWVGNDGNGSWSAMIRRDHMELWGVDTQTLYELAKANTPRLFPAEIKSMAQAMRELMGDGSWEGHMDELEDTPLYILSNRDGVKGAAAVLYEGVLETFAGQMGADLWILPSSIHEVLLMPCDESRDVEGLKEMVRFINQEEVPEEDILSNNVYRYSRGTGRVTAALEELARPA